MAALANRPAHKHQQQEQQQLRLSAGDGHGVGLKRSLGARPQEKLRPVLLEKKVRGVQVASSEILKNNLLPTSAASLINLGSTLIF